MTQIIRITGAPVTHGRRSILRDMIGLGYVAIGSAKRKGHYGVKDIGGFYHVVYHFSDGETLIMSDRYKTPEGAMKKLENIKSQAGQ